MTDTGSTRPRRTRPPAADLNADTDAAKARPDGRAEAVAGDRPETGPGTGTGQGTGPGPAAPAPGTLFGENSQFNRFADDPRWALALIRALVLEAAHPQVGGALMDNSTFVAHPWRRLRNTLVSLQRMFGPDEHARQREAARLNRLHTRLSGTDERARPYDAMDPEVRAWVVATLFDSAVTMCRLSGQPFDQDAMEHLYAEFRAFLAALAGDESYLPPTVTEFWPYYDRVVAEELENTEAVRIILYRLFDHLPAPPLLSGLPTVWAAGRALAGPVIGTITVASLPEPFRRKSGLPEVPGAQTLMQSAYVAAGLARFLPEGWLRAETVTDLLYLSPDSDDPRAAPLAALRGRMQRAGALFRLVAPLPTQRGPAEDTAGAAGATRAARATGAAGAAGDEPPRAAGEFFTSVLDQTGDGYLDWPDLAAMAREISSRLDLDEPAETRLYTACADWWRELQTALDTDGDGRVSKDEYAAAVPSLAGPALIRFAEVLFDATDADGDQSIDADEYRALFRTGFRRAVDTAGGRYSRSAFVNDFLSFMSARRPSTPFEPLLTEP
ncbi:oxygenase MpaB family protein [Actinacidiphila yeochonensis]|uniref:oxygenase MpaB family protein n=1 Tax=Actinacidiphila yeochonensis TaxID=89050 RepID=UPI00099D70B6|nr:oxygenase MpaB family protein [Actinacidiphila yeochonensis]